MVVYSFGKRRESTQFKSEVYKSQIRQYVELLGYGQKTDARLEGHFPDMIFQNSRGEYIYVESKATVISLSDQKFCNELLRYLVTWIGLPDGKKFELYIFAHELSKTADFERVFGSAGVYFKFKQWLKDKLHLITEEERKVISGASKADLSAFLSQLQILEIDPSLFEKIIEEKKAISSESIEKYSDALIREVELRRPSFSSVCLISNLVRTKVPSHFYSAKFDGRIRDLQDKYNQLKIDIPPLSYDVQGNIFSFEDLGNSNIKEDVTHIQKIPFDDNQSVEFRRRLIYDHLRRLFWKKGVYRIHEKNLFYFPTESKDGKFQERDIPLRARKKKVVKPYYTKTGELAFIFHEAVLISVMYLWGQWFIEIVPARMFTKDGRTPLDGETRAVIDRYFRNPMFNRNSSKMGLVQFWHTFLFLRNLDENLRETWMSQLNFHGLEKLEVAGGPPKQVRKK